MGKLSLPYQVAKTHQYGLVKACSPKPGKGRYTGLP